MNSKKKIIYIVWRYNILDLRIIGILAVIVYLIISKEKFAIQVGGCKLVHGWYVSYMNGRREVAIGGIKYSP